MSAIPELVQTTAPTTRFATTTLGASHVNVRLTITTINPTKGAETWTSASIIPYCGPLNSVGHSPHALTSLVKDISVTATLATGTGKKILAVRKLMSALGKYFITY